MMNNDPKTKFVFFDLETTGCPQSGSIFHDYHRIVQFSAVCGDETYDAIVNPQCHIPSESTAIHRVTNEMASKALNFGRIFPLFRTFIKKLSLRGTQIILVAHNAFGFDKLVLEKECSRFGLRVPATWKFYDSLLKYRSQYSLPSNKLGDIYKQRFSTELQGAHNSLIDCMALKKLFEHDLLPYFNIQDTLQVYEQQYLTDNQPAIKVRGIGRRTKDKIVALLQMEREPTIGDLRTSLMGCSYADIEMFIRMQLNCSKEQFVYSILCEIVQPDQPHLLFQNFPFLLHTFTVILPAYTVNTLLEKHKVRSAEQLKRFYLFKIKESGEKWDQLLKELNVNPFHISLMMRSI